MPPEMRCANCGYAVPRYDRNGTQIGVECKGSNYRFIEMEYAEVMRCGCWTEVDV